MPAFLLRIPPNQLRLLLLFGLAASWFAHAHPEDEFCTPGEGSLDPELCEQLMALDSPDGNKLRSQPILDASGDVRGFWSTAALYVTIGIRHILPGGRDHILFVLALFL
ncbi:MAG: hypothetical protein ACE5F8_02820, partial [Woeseiaceae bacterium]